jgi:hypothetical protein
VKANSGFYQGTGIRMPDTSSYMKTGKTIVGPYGEYDEKVPNPDHGPSFALLMCLSYGSAVGCDVSRIVSSLETMTNGAGKLVRGKQTIAFINAWVALCAEKVQAVELLDEARPLPVITEIGLSPRVTTTLKEMSLDVDLPSIKMAKISKRMVPGHSRTTGEPLLNRDGTPHLVPQYYVDWTPGTQMGRSRFNSGCQACGKSIPSGMFVPIEADDLKSGDHIGLWIGCDCARNIFGVKDIGVEKEK